MKRVVLAGFIAVLALLVSSLSVEGYHAGVACGPDSNPGRKVCLPYADSSFAVKTLQTTKHLTFCFNSRARNYPNFVSQVRDVNEFQGRVFGFTWVEIAGVYATNTQTDAAGCQVWHSMPEVHGCSGCGAWVHYLNNPALIEYRWQAGYTDWRTTIALELVHSARSAIWNTEHRLPPEELDGHLLPTPLKLASFLRGAAHMRSRNGPTLD